MKKIIQDDVFYRNSEYIANMFNDYFIDIGKKLLNRLGEIITIILITWQITTNLILFSSDQLIVIPRRN